MRDFVVSGLVREETVSELLAFGEPMLGDGRGADDWHWPSTPYRSWLRTRVGQGRRVDGVLAATPQAAADGLLRKLRERPS